MLKSRSISTIQLIRRIIVIRDHSTYVSDNVTVSLAPRYNPQIVEADKYKKWEKRNYFSPQPVDGNEKVFSIILPPPNITGTLHVGHALTVTIEDVVCRWKRMQGFSVLWVPGTDHAGIATQVMVEKYVFGKTGRTRHEIGRKLFFEHLLKWKAVKMNTITDQLKGLGASLDWSTYTFTMDPSQSVAVSEAIIRLFDDGFMYHENSLVNWCFHLQSTISDIEVDYHVLSGPTLLNVPGHTHPVEFGLMYDFAMKVIDPKGDFDDEVVISTTRPETIFGDVAVAVHPCDSRYSHLKDTFLQHPFRQCAIPVIFDEFVDPNFGTGAMKITPAHGRNDFEVAKNHNLPMITIFDEFGRLNENCKEFIGQMRFAVRNPIISQLSALSLLRGVRKHPMRIPFCSRSGDVIEQMIRPQWFLKCEELAKRAIETIENGDIVIEPSKRVQSCQEWLSSLKVWCLSRQLWWGHRLPLYNVDGEWIAAKSPHEAEVKYLEKHKKLCEKVEQETDVLDTWFSSALLPFTVFGWPAVKDDLKKYYPLSLMETGVDLLYFWVIRMIMLGLYFNDKPPFKKVFLHAMVCDNLGRKMSKSLGNIIEPDYIIKGISLEKLNKIVETSHSQGLLSSNEYQKALNFQAEMFPEGIQACGADALRLSLAEKSVAADLSIIFNPEECVENSRFCNKLWQASKFIIGWACKFDVKPELTVEPVSLWQRWLLHRLYVTVENVNTALETMKFAKAVNLLKQFLINDFCDVFLEVSKPVLKSDSSSKAEVTASIMLYCLETYLRLLSPFVPFICDEIYSHLPDCSNKMVAECAFPHPDEYSLWKNERINEEMELVRKTVQFTRSLLQVIRCKNRDSDVEIFSSEKDIMYAYIDVILSLTRCRSVGIRDPPADIVGPAFTLENKAVVHVILKEVSQNHLKANYNFLVDRIARLCSILNEKIKVDANNDISDSSEESESDTNSDSSETSDTEMESEKAIFHNEWKNFEAELKVELEKFCMDSITVGDIKKMIIFLEKIHEFRLRFKSLTKKTDSI